MATDKKTAWITLDTQLYYAQVFDENRDNGDIHAETNGVYKVTMKVTPEQVEQLKALGVPESALGYPTFKDVTIDGENFIAYTAKRPVQSKYLKDEANEPLVMGEPMVFDLNKAFEAYNADNAVGYIKPEYKTKWKISDGLLGNGTEAKVKLSVYRGKNKAGKPTCVVQLEEIAVVKLVPYVGNGEVRF
jgi:hypothetical protein